MYRIRVVCYFGGEIVVHLGALFPKNQKNEMVKSLMEIGYSDTFYLEIEDGTMLFLPKNMIQHCKFFIEEASGEEDGI